MPEVKPPAMGPGRRVVFRPDHKSFGEFITSERMRGVVAQVAKDIADLAGKYAPRRKSGQVPDGAAMADSFKVNREAGTIFVGKDYPNKRVMVHVYNEKRSAAPMEFGNEHVKGHRMLGRAGAVFGDFKAGKGRGLS